MPTIAKGNTAEVFVPLSSNMTFTPGSGGSMRLAFSVANGADAIEPRTIYSAMTIAVTAGATVFAEAVGADATYTEPSTVASIEALVSGAFKCVVGDGRVFTDATLQARTGAGTTTFGSPAQAQFTQEDVGKLFGVHATSATVGYTIVRGHIVSVESATSATVYVDGTVSAIASNGSAIIGTDMADDIDEAMLAVNAAGGGTVMFYGMACTSAEHVQLDGVNLMGAGRGYMTANSFIGFLKGASGITYLGRSITNYSVTASISGDTMTVTALGSGSVQVGNSVRGTGVLDGTRVIERLTGTGGSGTYRVNKPQTVASTTLSANGSLIHQRYRRHKIENMAVDAANGCDLAVDQQEASTTPSNQRIINCNIARGYTTTLKQSGSSNVRDSEIYGAFRGTPVEHAGDSQLVSNYIFGPGDNLPCVYANGPVDDIKIDDNHLYRCGWGISAPNNPGSHIRVLAWMSGSTSTAVGGTINGNQLDTCEGHSIVLDIGNGSANRPGIQGLSICGNHAWQPQTGWTDNTYAFLRVNVGSGGSNPALLRALSVVGNVGRGCPSTQQGQGSGTQKRWKAIVEWNVQATYGAVQAEVVMGNAFADCVAVHSNVGAAFTPNSANNYAYDGSAEVTG